MSTADLLLHPIRMRIVLALGGREMTTAELAQALPDVARTSLYRQVATLADNDVLEVASEQTVRGAVERTYRIRGDEARIDDPAALDPEALKQGIAAFATAVAAEFSRAVDSGAATPESVSFRQIALELPRSRVPALAEDLREVIERYEGASTDGPDDPERHLLSIVLHPTA